ncbi:MipA/OmpV family protein [Thalassotalea nanhaiensis]|uniref:MipA/OmpV family protein n=1 Tax=Thalassotalea nanhaiensis TaxID=3065648 RepID=A0ABY9TGE4_9GAMM|nr:MipA/OmpV family protein [Colwelliaceae bacterium SQ345]
MMNLQLKISIFLCAFALISIAQANQGGALSVDTSAGKPVWEAGVFSAAFRGPIYPAATDYQNKFLPLPFVIYRGEKIRIGDESVIKAIAVEKEHFKLDVSLGAAFNADSEDSKIREGMPDLDFMFEIGPQASFLLHDNKSSDTWLNLQLRSVFSTDFSNVNHRGYVFQPEVAYQSENLLFDDSRFYFSVSPTFASAKTHQYFYDIDQQYVNSERDYFQSSGGYLGTKVSIANRFQLNKNLMMFVGTQLGLWHGAKNDESDLYQEKFTYTVALGIKWTVFQSIEHIK